MRVPSRRVFSLHLVLEPHLHGLLVDVCGVVDHRFLIVIILLVIVFIVIVFVFDLSGFVGVSHRDSGAPLDVLVGAVVFVIVNPAATDHGFSESFVTRRQAAWSTLGLGSLAIYEDGGAEAAGFSHGVTEGILVASEAQLYVLILRPFAESVPLTTLAGTRLLQL